MHACTHVLSYTSGIWLLFMFFLFNQARLSSFSGHNLFHRNASVFCAFSSVLELGASGSLDWNVRCGHASKVVPRSTQWQYKYWKHAYGCLHVNAKAMSVDPLKLGTLWGCLHLLWLLGIALHLLCYLCYDCLDMLSTHCVFKCFLEFWTSRPQWWIDWML